MAAPNSKVAAPAAGLWNTRRTIFSGSNATFTPTGAQLVQGIIEFSNGGNNTFNTPSGTDIENAYVAAGGGTDVGNSFDVTIMLTNTGANTISFTSSNGGVNQIGFDGSSPYSNGSKTIAFFCKFSRDGTNGWRWAMHRSIN